MKPHPKLRNFLALTGSSLLAISYAQAQTILADSYLTTLDVSTNTTLWNSLNFPSFLNGPLTGSSYLTLTGFFGSQLSLVGNTGNTFTGNIIVDSGTLRIAGSPFASNGGFVAPSMTSSDTITINRAGTLLIDDNVNAGVGGYTADRFGSLGSRPSVILAGGTINLNGRNNASVSTQTFGALTLASGTSTINVTRNSAGTPTLTFGSLAKSSGAYVNFTGTLLGSGANDGRILFTSAPTLIGGGSGAGTKTMSILAGARSGNDFVWYDSTNGIRPLATAEYNDFASNDIGTAGATENVRITGATPLAVVALAADKTVNSLIMTSAANLTWAMGSKLTLTSGQFMSTPNNTRNITSGVITAGSGSAIDLNMTILQSTTTVGANINDNGVGGVVTLVKAGAGGLTLGNNTTNNGYTGGTYVLEGTLTTGATSGRNYLGSGKVTVDGTSQLTLGSIGATSNSSGDDYTAINGGRIAIASGAAGAYTANDTFNIGANSVISGNSASGQGLASLTRGTNITLAEDAIIGHEYILTTALNLTTGTIKNLGANADLYYGFNGSSNQAGAGAVINIGTGTAFKGLTTYGAGGTFDVGTINVGSGTTDVYIKTNGANTAGLFQFTMGDTFFAAGAPTIALAGEARTVNVNILGSMRLNDTAGTYGNTGTGHILRFVSTAGSTLTVSQAAGMGSTSVANALIQNGGTLVIGNTAALNGAVTVEAGGRLQANQASGLTGAGALTFNEGSIIEVNHATGFMGAQTTSATIAAGTIVKLNASFQPGTSAVTFDSMFGSKSPIYHLTGDVNVPDPIAAGTTTMTLNKNGSGVGGIVTNGSASAFFRNDVNGHITIGANGGVMAATTGTELQIQETITGTDVTLTIGTTAIIDGLPKFGSLALGSATGSNTYTGQTIIAAGTLRTGYINVLGATTNQLTINTGGTLNTGNNAQTVGNFTGTGGTVIGGSVLTIGEGNNGGGNYQGSIQGTTALTKTGTATITLSGENTNTGVTTVSAGVLKLNHLKALSGGIAATGGTSNLTINGGGVVGLADGNFSRGIGAGVTQVQWTGSGGFAAYGGTRTVLLSGSSINWNATSFIGDTRTLVLGSADADGTVDWQQQISMAGGTRTVQVRDGSATVDAIMSGAIAGGSSGTSNGFTKTGAGTLAFTSNSNNYWGATTVSDGTLTVGNGSTTGILSSNSATISVVSGATLAVNRSNAVSQAASGGLGNGSAIITGAGGFTQAGAGTTTLTLANLYTGATSVTAGTLIINGSTSSTSLVNVGVNGTLGGTGTVGGNTTISGTHNPGNSPGIQTFSGNLSYVDAGTPDPTVNWELANNTTTVGVNPTANYDQIIVGGNLVFTDITTINLSFNGAGSNVLWSDVLWDSDQSWLLYDVAGTTTNFANLNLTMINWLDSGGNLFSTTGGSFSLGQSGQDVVLNFSVIPEPNVAALLGGLGTLLLLRRRRA